LVKSDPVPINSSTGARFRSPDGGWVILDAAGYDLEEPWSASVRVTTKRPYAGTPDGLQLRDLHIANTGNYDLVLERVLDGRWVNIVEAQGGNFLIGHSDTAEQGLAVWRGPWHEAATWLPDPKMSGSDALRYLARLYFEDSPEGLCVMPTAAAIDAIDVLDVSKKIPDVGFLDIRKPETAHQLVPAWSGAPVPTGEVWMEELAPTSEGAPQVVLVHATPSTVTTLSGPEELGSMWQDRMKFLHNLNELSWKDE
jgi:hypothetical protein